MNVSSPGQWRRTSVAIMLGLPGIGVWNYSGNLAGGRYEYWIGFRIVLGSQLDLWGSVSCEEAIVCINE